MKNKHKCELLQAIERDLLIQSILELIDQFIYYKRTARTRSATRHLEKMVRL